MTQKTDSLFASEFPTVKEFAFDDSVADVFADMISRSIPGYAAIIRQVGSFARRYVKDDTNIYDLGCSLGASSFAVRHAVNRTGCHIISVDTSEPMLNRFKAYLSRDVGVVPIELRCEDALHTSMENASFTIMNFTLQFIDFDSKQAILTKIFDSLVPRGALLLSEKIVFSDAQEQQEIEEFYFDFKRFNGYNDLEVSQKRDALENVLKLDTGSTHIQRLKEVGFRRVYPWFSHLNFASFLAVK